MSKNTGYVVQLTDQPSWLAPWTGDPGRTLCLENARVYETRRGAKIALGMVRSHYWYRNYTNAKIATVRVSRRITK